MPAKLDTIDLKLKRAIAQRFRNIREGTGKTQQDFAHGSGRDKQSYSKNERGKGASIYTVNFCNWFFHLSLNAVQSSMRLDHLLACAAKRSM